MGGAMRRHPDCGAERATDRDHRDRHIVDVRRSVRFFRRPTTASKGSGRTSRGLNGPWERPRRFTKRSERTTRSRTAAPMRRIRGDNTSVGRRTRRKFAARLRPITAAVERVEESAVIPAACAPPNLRVLVREPKSASKTCS